MSPHRSLRPLLLALALAAAAALIAASAAPATTLVYRDGSNVWEASPDGTIKRAVTADGTTDSYYSYPSVDDAGTITAMRSAGSSRVIWVKPRASSTPTVNAMPWRTSTWVNIGPNWARVKPTTGNLLAYTYFWNHGPNNGYPNGGLEDRYALVTPTAPGSPTLPAIDQPAVSRPTWLGDRLVGSKNGQIVYEAQPLNFQVWLSNSNTTFDGAEVNRQVNRVLIRRGDGRLELLGYQGTPPGGALTFDCLLPATGVTVTGWALSPDGDQVAWVDAAGLHTANVSSTAGTSCPIAGSRLISATGLTPAFSQATLTTPDDPPPVTTTTTTTTQTTPTTTTTTQSTPTDTTTTDTQTVPTTQTTTDTQTGPATTQTTPTKTTTTTTTTPQARATVAVSAARSGRATTLRRTIRAAVTTSGPGRVSLLLSTGKRSLGTGTFTVKRAGRTTLSLRPTKAAAKRIAKGRKLTLKVVYTPKAGGAVSRSVTIAVR